MLNRLGLLIHWIGFLCLIGFIGFYAGLIILNDVHPVSAVGAFVDALAFEVEGWSVVLWIGIVHWPIKWLITGNKAFFPWKS
jgi:hypothetical protein